jgi:hypothetical protein
LHHLLNLVLIKAQFLLKKLAKCLSHQINRDLFRANFQVFPQRIAKKNYHLLILARIWEMLQLFLHQLAKEYRNQYNPTHNLAKYQNLLKIIIKGLFLQKNPVLNQAKYLNHPKMIVKSKFNHKNQVFYQADNQNLLLKEVRKMNHQKYLPLNKVRFHNRPQKLEKLLFHQ